MGTQNPKQALLLSEQSYRLRCPRLSSITPEGSCPEAVGCSSATVPLHEGMR